MATRIIFTANYNHKWPSRAVTAFKAGWSGLVKDEVAISAIAAGRAVHGGDTVPADETPAPADMAGTGSVADADGAVPDRPALPPQRPHVARKRKRAAEGD